MSVRGETRAAFTFFNLALTGSFFSSGKLRRIQQKPGGRDESSLDEHHQKTLYSTAMLVALYRTVCCRSRQGGEPDGNVEPRSPSATSVYRFRVRSECSRPIHAA